MSILKIKDNQGDWVEIPSVSPGPNRIQITNTVVAAVDFSADSTYEDFPYRAAIAIANVDSTMTPDIIFAPTDATSGKFCSISNTYDGGVYIYALEIPEADITIPTIICWYAPSRVLGGSDTIAVTSVNNITSDNAGNVDLTVVTDMIADGAITQDKLNESIELGMAWTKIWENASPLSAFPAQTITVDDMSEYEYIAFIAVGPPADPWFLPMTLIPKSSNIHALLSGYTGWFRRAYILNNTQVEFTDATIDGTVTNAYVIPNTIFGIKGVQ